MKPIYTEKEMFDKKYRPEILYSIYGREPTVEELQGYKVYVEECAKKWTESLNREGITLEQWNEQYGKPLKEYDEKPS